MAAWGRMPRTVLALDVLMALAAAVALVLLWRRRPAWRPWLVPAALCAAFFVVTPLAAFGQSSDAKPENKAPAGPPGDPGKDAQRRSDEFAEAARVVNGPAGNPTKSVRKMLGLDTSTSQRAGRS